MRLIIVALGTVLAFGIVGCPKPQPAPVPPAPEPQPLTIYSDAIVGPTVTFSAGFDATRYKLKEDAANDGVTFWARNSIHPSGEWIDCDETQNEGGTNCGSGRVNIFFVSTQPGVPIRGGLLQDGKTWMVSAKALPPGISQNWRVRIQLRLLPK